MNIKYFILTLTLFLIACTPISNLNIENVQFATFNERNQIEFKIDKEKPIYLFIGKISGLQNQRGTIQPEITVELTELKQRRSFLGEKIKTSSTGIESSTFPLGKFPKGTYTLKIIVKDRSSEKQVTTTKILIVS